MAQYAVAIADYKAIKQPTTLRDYSGHLIHFVEFLETKPDTIARNAAENDMLVYALYGVNEESSSPYGMKRNTGNRGMNSPAFRVASCGLLAIYVAFVLNSKNGRLQMEQLSSGSGQQELYPKDKDNFYIPLINKARRPQLL